MSELRDMKSYRKFTTTATTATATIKTSTNESTDCSNIYIHFMGFADDHRIGVLNTQAIK